VRDDGGPARSIGHLDRGERFSQRSNLIQFDQD
jgi:hypothetical protein